MLDIPKSVKELFKTDGVLKNFRVHFPDGEREDICNDQIVRESVKFQESLCSRDKIKFGYCEQSVLKFSCVGVENIKGMRIQAQYEIDVTSIVSTGIEYNTSTDVPFPYYILPLGTFYVDDCKMDASMEKRNVTAYSQAMDEITEDESGAVTTVFWTSQRVKVWVKWQYSKKLTFDVNVWNLIAMYMGNTYYNIIKPCLTKLTLTENNYGTTYPFQITLTNGKHVYLRIRALNRKSYNAGTDNTNPNCWPSLDNICYVDPTTKIQVFLDNFLNWVYAKSVELFGAGFNTKNRMRVRSNYMRWLGWSQYGYMYKDTKGYDMQLTDECRAGFAPFDGMISIWTKIEWARIVEKESGEGGQILAEYNGSYELSDEEIGLYKADKIWVQNKDANGNITSEDYKTWYQLVGLPKWNAAITTVKRTKTKISNAYWTLEDYYGEFFTTFTESMEDYVECSAQIAGFDRYGQYHLYSLKNGRGLFPSVELYPSDTLYPANENNAGRVTRDHYISAWLDDEYIEFGSVTCVYTDANGEEVEYTKILDEENYESMKVYDLSDNAYLQSCGTSGQYSIIEDAVDKIAEELDGFAYIPADVKLKGLPYIECGDSIWIRTKNGAYVTSVLQNTISGIQDLRQQIVSK